MIIPKDVHTLSGFSFSIDRRFFSKAAFLVVSCCTSSSLNNCLPSWCAMSLSETSLCISSSRINRSFWRWWNFNLRSLDRSWLIFCLYVRIGIWMRIYQELIRAWLWKWPFPPLEPHAVERFRVHNDNFRIKWDNATYLKFFQLVIHRIYRGCITSLSLCFPLILLFPSEFLVLTITQLV